MRRVVGFGVAGIVGLVALAWFGRGPMGAFLSGGVPELPPGTFPRSYSDPLFDDLRVVASQWDVRTGPIRRVVDVVVLVPDVPTFLEAIATWDQTHYFPILIDEPETTIGFIRAFRPARLVRLPSAKPPGDLWAAATVAVGAAWTAPGVSVSGSARPELAVRTPPGCVVSTSDSSALAGGVALAAGRFQPVLRWDIPERPADLLTEARARELTADLDHRVAGVFGPDVGLGDACDFVTLAGDWPFRYEVATAPGRGIDALDDLLARDLHDGRRKAYVGRLVGDAPRAVYQAMCSLFLPVEDALLFNTYGEASVPWSYYDIRPAADRLALEMPVRTRRPDQADWQRWHEVFRPRNASRLVLVNTSGGPTAFHLPGSRGGRTEDIPLTDPAAVLFTHSFSAADPYDPSTLAGRWLANGAFVYFGAVHEPYLNAFRPPDLVAEMILARTPLAAALRRTHREVFGQPWRLLYVGDPLYTWQPSASRRPRVAGEGPVASWPLLEPPRADTPSASAETRLAAAYDRVLAAAATLGRKPGPDDLDTLLRSIPRDQLGPGSRVRLDALIADHLSRSGAWAELRDRIRDLPTSERTPAHRRWLDAAESSLEAE